MKEFNGKHQTYIILDITLLFLHFTSFNLLKAI